jgi:hypothetical protein
VLLVSSSPVLAQQVPGGSGWAPGPGAILDNTYQGFIDQPQPGANVPAGAAFHVTGWIVDMAAEGWAGIDDVQVLQGDRVLVHGSVGGSRPDVAAVTGNPFWASSGFDAVLPAGALSGGPATLTVAAHTPGKGTWTREVSVNVGAAAAATGPVTGFVVSITSPGPNEEVAGTNDGTVFGVAYDTRTRAELGAGVDRIQVYLDAERDLPGSQSLGETVPTSSTWAVHWEPTKFNSFRHHVMFVYARSAVTGEERLLTQEINIAQN